MNPSRPAPTIPPADNTANAMNGSTSVRIKNSYLSVIPSPSNHQNDVTSSFTNTFSIGQTDGSAKKCDNAVPPSACGAPRGAPTDFKLLNLCRIRKFGLAYLRSQYTHRIRSQQGFLAHSIDLTIASQELCMQQPLSICLRRQSTPRVARMVPQACPIQFAVFNSLPYPSSNDQEKTHE
jgi:hypothetical protein